MVTQFFPDASTRPPAKFPKSWSCWVLNPVQAGLRFYLVLGPSPKNDSFIFELGWNNGELPEFDGYPAHEAKEKERTLFRISSLWKPFGFEERWYLGSVSGPQAMMMPAPEPFEVKQASIRPQLEDAFERLRRLGIPYLRDVAARHGVNLNINTTEFS